jgi:hypothetical protein
MRPEWSLYQAASGLHTIADDPQISIRSKLSLLADIEKLTKETKEHLMEKENERKLAEADTLLDVEPF